MFSYSFIAFFFPFASHNYESFTISVVISISDAVKSAPLGT
nr:MAG TPA: hypothetical protein [Caudoviricetes sp.]